MAFGEIMKPLEDASLTEEVHRWGWAVSDGQTALAEHSICFPRVDGDVTT